MDVRPLTLHGDRLRLEPLSIAHAGDLWRACDEETCRYMNFWSPTPSPEAFADLIDSILSRPGFVSFAMVVKESGRAVGSSAYFDIHPEHRNLEIGATWISADHRGSWVNAEAKLLMLGHAFESLGFVRVQLKTDARNVRSQRAMEKLGCVREGVLRKHMVCRDGFVRDTAMYSIVADEWPSVRETLLSRIRP